MTAVTDLGRRVVAADWGHVGLDVLAWTGLLVTVAVFALAARAFWCCSRRVDPDRPIYLLLAAATVPGIAWFLSSVIGIVGTSDAWRAWSRVVLFTPYLSIGIVIVLRMLRHHQTLREGPDCE